MNQDRVDEILEAFAAEAHSRPSPIEYEMAYEAYVACDRIRCAIRHIEQAVHNTNLVREANLQLLEAFDRLTALDRRFQVRSRSRRAGGDAFHRVASDLKAG